MSNHEGLFPYSDNLITLMFIVASDLTEAQRETYKFPFSWKNECHCFYLWSIEDNIFGIICTPKGSKENPSLRVSGHVSSMNRTFIVEDFAEDDFRQWAKDEVTG